MLNPFLTFFLKFSFFTKNNVDKLNFIIYFSLIPYKEMYYLHVVYFDRILGKILLSVLVKKALSTNSTFFLKLQKY